jgi:predicted nucleic acid-binding protein
MILADTSAWAELFRRTGSPVHTHLASILGSRDTSATVAITEPVVFELLAGRATSPELVEVRRRLLALRILNVGGLDTWELAAAIARTCRSHGHTIGSQMDCLIAAVAIRENVPVLAADRDFDVIAHHTALQLEAVT